MAYNPPPLSHLKRQTSIPPTPMPGHLMNGHRPPLPPTNGDMNNNMSSSGQPPLPNQAFGGATHLKNGPMSLGTPS
ncbi:hypothetical protein D910_11252 [Dendroctonus ponderosae]|nr:hypothetical protein D910_11252 [Dendroctonus ponderosae]